MTTQLDLERYAGLARVGSVAVSPDGSWAAVAVARLDADGAKYVSDLYRLSLTDRETAPLRLTHGDTDDRAPCFRSDGALAFLSNRPVGPGEPDDDAKKRSQVFLMDAAGGEPRAVTDEPLGVLGFRYAARASVLVVLAPVLPGVDHAAQRETWKDRTEHGPSALHYRSMPVRYWDHWLDAPAPHLVAYDGEGGGRKDLTPEADREHREASFAVSADGRHAVITCAVPSADRVEDVGLRLFDLETGAATDLATDPRSRHDAPRFSPDGTLVVSTREARFDEKAQVVNLWLHELASGEGRVLAGDWDRWPTPSAFTADGRHVVCTADDRGTVPVFLVDLSTGERTRITAEAAGGVHAEPLPIPGTDRILGIRSTLLHPPEVFEVAAAAEATPSLVTRLSGFAPEEGAALARVSTFSVPATDGFTVESFLVEPAAMDARGPALLWIHGGPMGQHHDGWHWRWNPLLAVAAGYRVALPNPRGSTGKGHAFVDGIWGNVWGAGCYDDLMRVTDALAARDDVDEKRIGAMGGSFGGYMSNWIGGQTDRFGCIVTHASLYDLSAFHGVTDWPAYFSLELGGNPADDPDGFDRYSPHRFVKQWKSPTLVIHGEKDYRVPQGEGLALFEALQAHGVDSELLVFPDENHWILKPRNVVVWYRTVLDFVGRHLSG